MKKTILLAFFIHLSNFVFPCSCINPTTYCETMQSETSDLLILGYKITNIYHGMSIKVVQVLEGTETRDTITVWGDNGILCRHFSSAFSLNDTIVFALHNCDLYGNSLNSNHEQPDHYQISNCGVYYLNYSNGQVIGSIDNGVSSLSLSNFLQTHTSCSTTTFIKKNNSNINLHPNPTHQKVFFQIRDYNGSVETQIYDLSGRLLENTNSKIINLENYTKGIYMFKISYANKVEELKVVKH